MLSRVSRNAFLSVTGAAATVVAAPVRAAQYEFKCGAVQPAEHPTIVRGKQMWLAVEKETGGRVRTQMFASGALGSDAGMLSQLRIGALQFLSIGGGLITSLVPEADIANVGFAFKDEDEALRVIDGQLGDFLRREVASKGVYTLRRIWDSGMRDITSSSHPIRTVEDLNGFKIRTSGSRITVDFFKTLGASPTPLDISSTYTALQTKFVDGNEAPLVTIETGHYYEPQKYLSLTNHTWNGLWLIGNGDLWKSLPADIQDTIERNNTKYSLLARRDIAVLNASVTDKLARQGLGVNTVDQTPFRARLRPFYETWAKNFGATAWGLLESSVGRKLG